MKQLSFNRIGFWVLMLVFVLSSCTKTHYKLTVEANDPAMGTVYGSGEYAPNTEVEIGAQATTGYLFVRWNDGNTENPRSVRISSDLTFIAIFEQYNNAPAFETSRMSDQYGRWYNTVKIGGNWWMAEDMAVKKNLDGQDISAQNGEMSHNVPLCYITSNNAVLYNWPAAMSVCPEGWHLPSSEEWSALEQTLQADPQFCFEGDPSKIAKALAVRNIWMPYSELGTPGYHQMYNNTSGFGAYPNGKFDGEFKDYRYTANIWLSDSFNDSIAHNRTISYDKPTVNNGYNKKNVGLSVRCVREGDDGEPDDNPGGMPIGK